MLEKVYPLSPDPAIKDLGSNKAQAAVARMAHLNKIIDYINEKFPANGTYQLPTLAADPVDGLSNGQMYYNTTTHQVRAYKNGVWSNL